MIAILIGVLVLVWLLIGLSTGAYIASNNWFIAGWPWPGRVAVILLGPITGVLTILYFVGEILAMLVTACTKSAWDFMRG
ncbi:hypothetical protein HYS42_00430 [Candidatus Saccharibacteria bacterium]|nr:hypothetical protein [Candidatus Saccharibacteria bacterium]